MIENCICGNKNVHTRECKSHNRDLYLQNYYKKNKKRIKEVKKDYEQTAIRRERRREYEKQKKKSNIIFYLSCKLRSQLWITLKRYSKTGKIKSSDKYGINFKEIIERLKPFPKDMSNYHIDHIIPLSLFDLNNPIHIKKAFSPENHQWLTTQQNLEKGNRLVMPQI